MGWVTRDYSLGEASPQRKVLVLHMKSVVASESQPPASFWKQRQSHITAGPESGTKTTHAIILMTVVFWLLERLVGLVVKASASRAEDSGFESRDFLGSSHTSGLKIGTPVATLPGAWCYRISTGTGCPVSVYYAWMRCKVWSATSVSVWQHVKLSEQIRPWDKLACCWDVKQQTNKLLVA